MSGYRPEHAAGRGPRRPLWANCCRKLLQQARGRARSEILWDRDYVLCGSEDDMVIMSSNAVPMLHCLESGTGLLRAGHSLTAVRQKCPALDVVRAEALGAIRDGIRFVHVTTVQSVGV